jgi:prevent-host-death family protein
MSDIYPPEPSVTAKDFQRHPGRYQRLAQARPVTITAHGEPSLVIMSISEYRRLKRRDRQALAIDKLTVEQAELLEALRATEPDPEDAQFNDELDGWKP